ncbi:MAG: sugar ABC transporter permease [Clostridia bacterium]|nr:sugar ABC transporter permease [Clostridia bacterium]
MTNNAVIDARPKKKRRKIASLDRRKARAGWFFVLPFVLGFLLIYIPMFIDSVVMSFQTMDAAVDGSSGYIMTFVGIENYRNALLVDPDFAQTLVTGLKQLAFDVPAILIFSLFMAVMLNQKMAGRGFFRAIFFLPVILATGIMESIAAADTLNAAMSAGIDDGSGTNTTNQIVSSMDFERLFSNMKVGTELVEYVTSAINNIYDIVNRSGVQMLIFLAALQSISPAIYESCKIDGATAWETFWKITFPMISPMILVNAVYTIIDSFTTESNQVMTYISSVYSRTGGMVVSSAMSWIYFLLVIVIVAVIAGIFSAFVFYGRKND